MPKKMMLMDPQCKNEPLVLCFKNEENYNAMNSDQFVCDIPLKSALQIAEYFGIDAVRIDYDVQEYLRGELK